MGTIGDGSMDRYRYYRSIPLVMLTTDSIDPSVKDFFFWIDSVPDNKSRNIPEVVLVRRWEVGVLGIWRGGVGWVKGGANGVSLSATWD
jgi:hypothetical protein